MKNRLRFLAFLMAGLVILALSAGLAACGGNEPQNVDPQAVLATASANMKQISGFHFVYQVSSKSREISTPPGTWKPLCS
jgi:hypothetical protein